MEKEKWIKAYESVLDLYKRRKHRLITTECAKCMLVDHTGFYNTDKTPCHGCPEDVFFVGTKDVFDADTLVYNPGCMQRVNTPAFESSVERSEAKREKVVVYHEQAIKFLKNASKFNLVKFQEALIDIDANILNIINYEDKNLT